MMSESIDEDNRKRPAEAAVDNSVSESTKRHKREEGDGHRVWRTNDDAASFITDSRFGFSSERIQETKEMFQEHKIETVKNLQQAVHQDSLPNTFLALSGSGIMISHLVSKIEQPMDLEERLHDIKFISGSSGKRLHEEIKQEAKYTEEAVSVKLPQEAGDRSRDIRIVLGPSGSGKTLYAINGLSALGQEQLKSVCVYFSLADLAYVYSNRTDKEVASHLGEETREALCEAGKVATFEKQLDMRLSVVLDEALAVPMSGTMACLSKIFDELQQLAKHIRLIIAGTGYESISTGLSSSTDVFKYRMQAWNDDSIKAAFKKQLPGTWKEPFDFIVGTPMLYRLSTNARMAIYIYEVVLELLKAFKRTQTLKGKVATVIDMAIKQFIVYNGISGLDTKERRIMVYAVFHEINNSDCRNEPSFPKLATLEGVSRSDKIRRQALGVLDVHVETAGNQIVFVGESTTSVSVTPAMGVLLFSLLGVEATVYNGWEGLEVVAALHAAYLEVLRNERTRESGVRLARLTHPVPEPNAKSSFRMPATLDTTPTIWINGLRAPFCDVLANFHGFQSKFSKEGDVVKINLDEELMKCGLVSQQLDLGPNKDSAKVFKMGNAVLRAFWGLWSQGNDEQQGGQANVPQQQDETSTQSYKTSNSPAFQYPRRVVAEDSQDARGVEWKVDDSVFVLDRVFTLTFFTNARKMELGAKGQATVTISHDQVGLVDGNVEPVELATSLDDLQGRLGVKGNVSLRFVFCG